MTSSIEPSSIFWSLTCMVGRGGGADGSPWRLYKLGGLGGEGGEKEALGQWAISDTLHHNKWSRTNVPSINALAGSEVM